MRGLLPNGSVVLLKGMDHRVMIYGRIQKDDATEKVYDYAGCYYPEGLLDSNKIILFNREDIDMIFFLGFQDVEELAYRAKLYEAIDAKQDEMDDITQSNSR